MLLLPETPLTGAVQVSEKLRQAVADLLVPGVGRVTISMGVASSAPDGSLPAKEILKLADEALYRAKQDGRNRVAAHGLHNEALSA